VAQRALLLCPGLDRWPRRCRSMRTMNQPR
jgi:hypothetical protein